MKIYVASSWNNAYQPRVVELLRQHYEVYDFRAPSPGTNGFSWADIDENWQDWSTQQYFEALERPEAKTAFMRDLHAMRTSDACILVLPSGRSSHIEAGWMRGAGKSLLVYIPEEQDPQEPELMHLLANAMCTKEDELIPALKSIERGLIKSVSRFPPPNNRPR